MKPKTIWLSFIMMLVVMIACDIFTPAATPTPPSESNSIGTQVAAAQTVAYILTATAAPLGPTDTPTPALLSTPPSTIISTLPTLPPSGTGVPSFPTPLPEKTALPVFPTPLPPSTPIPIFPTLPPATSAFNLINHHTQECLDVSNQNLLVQTTCTGQVSQLWQRVQTSTGSYQLINASNDRCLLPNGLDIHLSACPNGQSWVFRLFGSYYSILNASPARGHAAPVIDAGDYFQISDPLGQKCIDVDEWNHNSPGKIIYWDCESQKNDNQLWTFR